MDIEADKIICERANFEPQQVGVLMEEAQFKHLIGFFHYEKELRKRKQIMAANKPKNRTKIRMIEKTLQGNYQDKSHLKKPF